MFPLKMGGGGYGPGTLANIYLQKVDFAQLLVYYQSLTTASESRLFGSVERALFFYWADPAWISSQGA